MVPLFGCWPAPPPNPRAPTDARPHVVVVTLDTTRADRIGAYGHGDARTPTLDAMASKGRRYRWAYSPLPLTIPAHATLFTGALPPRHGIRSNGAGTLGPEWTTLAETLQAAGWHTGASVAAFVTTRQWGFSQGFDAYFDELPGRAENYWHTERKAEAVIDDALAWKASLPTGERAFLWVHLYDVHAPWEAPAPYLRGGDANPYDAELAYVDDEVARLVTAFDGEPTLWVFVGDHGEGLGDHGEVSHGFYVYNATQHVPWIMTGPRVDAAVVDEPASLADVMPTVLAHLGLPTDEIPDGRVVPGSPPKPAYMEAWSLTERFGLAPHLAVADGPWKLIDVPRPELYDVSVDPDERSDVAKDHPAVVERLRAWMTAQGVEPPAPSEVVAEADVAALEALGYVQASQPIDMSGPLADPKDHAHLLPAVRRLDALEHSDRFAEAEPLLTQLVAAYPKVIEFRRRQAALLRRLDRHDDAEAAVLAALEIAPDDLGLRRERASQLARSGRPAEAAVLFERIARAQPYAPTARAQAIRTYRFAGQRDVALERALAWAAEYPEDQELAGILGILLTDAGRVAEAIPKLQQGAAAPVPGMEVAWYLAALAVEDNALEAARGYLALEMEHHPTHLRAAVVLTRVCEKLGCWDESLAAAQSVLAAFPRNREMWRARGIAHFKLGRFAEARLEVDAGLQVAPDDPELMLLDANLMAQEGRLEEGRARFEAAKAAKAALEQTPADRPNADLGLPAVGEGQEVDIDLATLPAPDWDAGSQARPDGGD